MLINCAISTHLYFVLRKSFRILPEEIIMRCDYVFDLIICSFVVFEGFCSFILLGY